MSSFRGRSSRFLRIKCAEARGDFNAREYPFYVGRVELADFAVCCSAARTIRPRNRGHWSVVLKGLFVRQKETNRVQPIDIVKYILESANNGLMARSRTRAV